VDLSYGAKVESLQVGTAEILATDGESFKWKSQTDPTNSVLAVHLPANLVVGSADLRLQGPTGSSAVLPPEVVRASLNAPPASSGITFTPGNADDDTFPVSTREPFPLESPGAPLDPDQQFWSYALEFQGNSQASDGGASGSKCDHGKVTGFERHCPDPVAPSPGDGPPCRLTNGCPGDVCNAISGSYALTTKQNQVALDIDRGAPEGPEHYLGGWVALDGSSMPASGGGNPEAYLVLRSQRTGVELTIRHSIEQCQ
jgi:hypothetical protein